PTTRVQRDVEGGKLTLDLAPGRYQVTIKLKGYRKQKKTLSIEDRSVTILDVALHARSKR
ncbi:MAG TPA: PEGA domain-containing protein, partial [Polyangiales bacterium]